MIDLSGRTIIVTGAAGGIGFGIAKILAQVGAQIAVNDIDSEAANAAAAQLGNGSFGIAGDVADEADVRAMIQQTLHNSGELHGLVNNAGIGPPLLPIRSQTIEDWQRVIDVNLRGTFLMSKAAAEVMVGVEGAVIVQIASVAGLVPFPASHAYGVSKAGVIMMTKTLATELARHGIRVNAVAPGIIEAPMLDKMMRSPADMKTLLGRVPLGRLGRTEEIGRAVAFLCSSAASYITGTVLPVDGGWHAYGGAGPASRG